MSSPLPHTPLNHFLREARTDFLANAAHSSAPLRVVMGNEAGDLDSLVCAIAFSYLSYHRDSKAQRWYPLVQTERQDFKLRAENQLALKTCLIDEDHIISLDDWTRTVQSEEAPEIALVDHCKLAARWKPDLTVKAVIDHHADEKLYKNAVPRTIKAPTDCGSCASLLAMHFKEDLSTVQGSKELSRLLLSAIMIDTHNMDANIGKAKAVDLEAVGILRSLAGFEGVAAAAAADISSFSDSDSFFKALSHAKEDISHLSTRDLCRRDYKEYNHPSANSSNSWRVGLTSIPWSMQEWIARDGEKKFLDGCAAFCEERQLHLFGALTAYSDASGFHREIVFFAPATTDQERTACRKVADLMQRTKVDELDVKVTNNTGLHSRDTQGQPFVRVWEQRNLKATRKQVAPAFKDVCSKAEAPA